MPASSRQVSVLPTSLGNFEIVWSAKGLAGLSLPRPGSSKPKKIECRSLAQRDLVLLNNLERYFSGESVSWSISLDFGNATPFARSVWQAIATIPFGEVRSYAWLSEAADHVGSVRAVANACGANPFPIIIPCHRVISSDGSLGGFSAGLFWKKKLLAVERQSTQHRYEPLKLDPQESCV